MESEAKLQSQLLDPLEAIQSAYRTRYLQAFDEVTGKCEAVRSEIDSLPDSCPFKAIAELVKIDALASVDVGSLKNEVVCLQETAYSSRRSTATPWSGLSRIAHTRRLCPPCGRCRWTRGRCGKSSGRGEGQGPAALVNMASLLRQPALRSLLEQGNQEKFIADVLAAENDEKLAELLAERVPADPANARLLAKYLKKIVVKVIHLHEFHPTKTKVEKGDIESVVGEFREFLETAVAGDGKGQSTILEIK